MKIYPSYEEVKKIAKEGKYKVVPISTEILSDFTTPIETLKRLKNVSKHCYMLESASADMKWGRYTFLGYEPKLSITCMDGEIKVGSLAIKSDNPSDYIRQILDDYKSPRLERLPSFTGGLVGYFAYDYLKYSEPETKVNVEDSEGFFDADLILFDKVIAFDHVKQKIIVIVNMFLKDEEEGYNSAVASIENLVRLIRCGKAKEEKAGELMGDVTALFTKDEYCSMVEKAKG